MNIKIYEQDSNHTPGPWRVQRAHRDDTAYIMPANDDLDQIASTYGDQISLAEHVANASLIAAAPDLLALVKEIGGLLDDHSLPGNNPINWANAHSSANLRLSAIWNQARAAIARAEGKGDK